MNHAVATIADLDGQNRHFGIHELRQLERALEDRVHELNERVSLLLHTGHPADEATLADVDVLCAAIREIAELRDEADRQIRTVLLARRQRPRRRLRF